MFSLQVCLEPFQCPGEPNPDPIHLTNITDSAALVMGSMAKNIMEGGAAMFGQLILSQLQVQCTTYRVT